MTMPAAIAREAQKLATDRLVRLYTIDATALGGAVFRFTSSVDTRLDILSITSVGNVATVTCANPHLMVTGDSIRVEAAEQDFYNGDFLVTVTGTTTFTYNMGGAPGVTASGLYLSASRLNKALRFGGNTYIPIEIEVTGFAWNGQGTIPTPTLRMSNVNNIMIASVISLRSLVGADFTRVRTFRKHLDDGDDPGALVFPKEIYRINRKPAHNKFLLEFELGAAIDQEGTQIPGRICIKRTCTHRYRVWNATTGTFDYTRATCPYAGSTYFKQDNTPSANPSDDRCGKQLASCSSRFGNAPLPFRGVPGIGGR